MTRSPLLALVLLIACSAAPEEPAPKQPAPKQPAAAERISVIYFIGDGMGASQVTLGKVAADHLKQPYAFERFKVIGLAHTRSANLLVTDSAAGGTALATGVKTHNKMVGQDPAGKPLTSILRAAHAAGYATGLVSTARITHATPAAFAAHVPHRKQESKIAAQYMANAAEGYPQVLIGGGRRYFGKKAQARLKELGYAVITELKSLGGFSGTKVAGLLAASHVPYVADGGTIAPAMTMAAVRALARQKKPFFLMVEGGRIDHACHQHDAVGTLHDQLDFDKAIGATLDWAKGRDDVLIVVTADHATGSLGISELTDIKALLASKASTTHLVKSFKKGQYKALIAKCKEAFGVDLTMAEAKKVLDDPPDKYWSGTALGHFISHKMGVEFYGLDHQQNKLIRTFGHDGAMVPVFAWGAGASRFGGMYENTEIPRRMAALLGFPPLNAAPTSRPARKK